MKVYIIEGPDNTGKSTLCEAIKNYYLKNGVSEVRIKTLHFSTPMGDTAEEKAANADNEYKEAAKYVASHKTYHYTDVLILDRSWYGEYVYGQIYRNRTLDDVSSMIRGVEDIIINNVDPDDIKLIITHADNIDFIINHEDGKSLSNVDRDLLNTEIEKFDEILDNVTGLKHIVKLTVNKPDSTTEFEDINVLLNNIL
jgi:thymidylate kinase